MDGPKRVAVMREREKGDLVLDVCPRSRPRERDSGRERRRDRRRRGFLSSIFEGFGEGGGGGRGSRDVRPAVTLRRPLPVRLGDERVEVEALRLQAADHLLAAAAQV